MKIFTSNIKSAVFIYIRMIEVLFTLQLLLISKGSCEAIIDNHHGPIFSTEPLSRVDFSNSSGTEVKCGAEGVPTPQIRWHLRDSSEEVDVPGLRFVKNDGTLVLLPFDNSKYKEEVHNAVYQCSASNSFGSVLSKEVHVKGVIKEDFSPEVRGCVVMRGNTAVLRCVIPPSMRKFVMVESWIRSDGTTFSVDDIGIRSHTMLLSGELLIHDAQERESIWDYSCQIKNELTGERKISPTSGKVAVAESQAYTLPEIHFHRAETKSEEGLATQLPCVAQGNPLPSYKWLKVVNGVLTPIEENSRIWIYQGTLNIKKVLQSDAGEYQCIARNSIGERRNESTLVVTAPLSANPLPRQQTLDIGQETTLTCNVTGYPVLELHWKKDQQVVNVSSRIRLLSPDVLHITDLKREDSGMYQCFVYNDEDNAEGSAELKISDTPPTLLSMFAEQTAQIGNPISLKCTSMGNPTPQITWYLDSLLIGSSSRVIFGDYVTEHGRLISYLNITETRVEDGGEYTCHVTNDVGGTSHSARLNVYGPIFVRRMPNATAIRGEDLTIRCPYGGHPIKNIRWFKGAALLPLNHRQKVSHGGILTIQNVQKTIDEGKYSCLVQSEVGQIATGTTNVTVVVSPVIDQNFFRERNTVNEGSRTKLSCGVTRGDPPLRFHWMKDGQPFMPHDHITIQTTDDSSIVNFKTVSSSDRGSYECIVSNVVASANVTMQLIVNVPPEWTVEPANKTVVLGNTVWMDCAAAGFPAPIVTWKKLIYTENTAGDFTYVHVSPRAHRFNNGTLMLSHAEENDSGAYLCQANNGIDAGLSKIISLRVLVPPRFKERFKHKSVREGSNATLVCIATGYTPINITWYKNSVIFDINNSSKSLVRGSVDNLQTISELQIFHVVRNDSGRYSCLAVGSSGGDEAIRQLVVQGLPDAPSNITVANASSRSIKLQWDVLHDGNSHIIANILQYHASPECRYSDKNVSELVVSGPETSAILRNLLPGSRYCVTMMCENAIGRGPRSRMVQVTTMEEAPAGFPREVHVRATGPRSMQVSWKLPALELQYGYIIGYYVGYRISSSEENYTFISVNRTVENSSQFTFITGLHPFTSYDTVVRAYNSAGSGPMSIKIAERTLEAGSETPPSSEGKYIHLALYNNTTLIVSVAVTTLIILALLFTTICCFKMNLKDKKDYEKEKPPSEVSPQIKSQSATFSEFSCPKDDKGDFEETFFCNDSISSHKVPKDDLFVTIKRCPSRSHRIYMSAC